MSDNPQQNNGKSGPRRFLSIAVGSPLLAFGLIIHLGAVVRFAGGDLKLPLSTYVAAILFGGVLPTALGFFLIYKGFKKDQ